MKKAFDTYIKPLNDDLGRKLNHVKTSIEVQQVSTEQKLPVRLSYISHSGHRVRRLAGTENFYRALGLNI